MVKKLLLLICMFAVIVLIAPSNTHAGPPSERDLKSALKSGDLTEYFAELSTWLNKEMPSDVSKVTVESMKKLLKDKRFALALAQRQLIARPGVAKLNEFVKADKENAAFLGGLMTTAEILAPYLVAGEPREKQYIGSLDVLHKIFTEDRESRKGLYLKLAIGTSRAQAKRNNSFDGQPIDPVKRYLHFKEAHKKGELTPMFDTLSAWELEKVLGSWASDEDLGWGREMLRNMRPELVLEERYVRQVSEVETKAPDWGEKPHHFWDVLGGGGKCGPRAWFGRFINQAFGVPAWGVKQPGHAAVGFLGNVGWKVQYGRGWDHSRWGGMSGNQFLAIARAREYRDDFSQAEHLRWLAGTLTDKALADAVRGVATAIQKNPKGPRTQNRLPGKRPFTPKPEPAYEPVEGVKRIYAYNFVKSKDAYVRHSFVGGKQVNFAKRRGGWIDLKVDIPKPGKYGLKTYHAVCNGRCRLRIYVGDKRLGWMHLANTRGLWAGTREWEFQLPATDTIRFVFPSNQRGVSIKWIELRAK